MRYSFFLIIAGISLTVFQVNASLEDVTYPIVELGNCESLEDCFAYCDLGENYDACMAFAQDKELLSQEEIQKYREVQEVVARGAGPGGCATESACESYCGDLTHIDECLSFAQEHGLMNEEELAEAQKVQAAIDAGYTLPGGCTDEVSCESYCSNATNMEECIAFGKAAGFMSEEEVAEAEKFLTIMESGGTPGGCQNQETCEAYCADVANAQECLNFAVEAGFMTQEEADTARVMGMQTGEEFLGPGGCADEESCRAYCEQESNQEECSAFFGDRGGEFEGEDELQREGGPERFVGPGGCVGEEACRAYCSDPVNQGTCAAFFGESRSEEQDELKNDYPEYNSENGFEDYDSSQPQEYPSQESNEYKEEGESMPEYQYEGGENYDIYEYEQEGLYDDDVFESFDPGDGSMDFEEGDDHGAYDQIYVEPPSYREPPSGSSADLSAPSGDSSGDESHSTANTGFVSSATQLLGKVWQFLQI